MRAPASLVLAVTLAACSSSSESAAAPVAPTSGPLADRARDLFVRALEDEGAMQQLRDLVAAAPKRLSGSKGYDDAVAFAAERLRAIGCDDVRAEPVMVPCWQRGLERAELVGAEPMPLRVTALGGSVPTPDGGLEAEVVRVRSFDELRALGDRARGRIVFFDRPMPRAFLRTFQAYGDAVPQRSDGAIEAAKAGAAAALVRSVTTAIDEHPHTGVLGYEDGIDRVPAAAVATVDAEALARRLEAGPVRLRLELGCRTLPDVASANVVAELRGRERPDEIVLIGAHLDAWDLGEGAHDDGAGCAHVLEAMRLLATSGRRPLRTIRAVLFANEENGLRGALAYDAAHGSEVHVAAIETDSGGATPRAFSCSKKGDEAEAIRPLFVPLEEFGCGGFLPGGGGGADLTPLAARGVACFGLVTEGHRYFDFHHSALDVVANVHPRELSLGAAALAYAASALADR